MFLSGAWIDPGWYREDYLFYPVHWHETNPALKIRIGRW